MEHTLKCNVLKCRKELGDQALVTTCSHIFCVECSKRHGLSGPTSERRKTCPACNTQLLNPDDAVLTTLNLTEDYKTSVLSGLSPNIIMECAGRALSFWAYQTTQEIVYQRYFEKTLSGKLRELDQRLQKTVNDANVEIEGLREKLHAQGIDYNDMRRRYEELGLSYRDKCRKLIQVQELYDKVKRKAELGQMEAAASDAVDSNLQLSSRLSDVQFPEPATRHGLYEHQTDSAYIGQHHAGPDRGHGQGLVGGEGPVAFREDMAWSKPGPALAGVPHTPRGTPRRHGVGNPATYGLSTASGLGTGTPSTRGPSGAQNNYIAARQPPSMRGRGLGVGLSSGIRASQAGHGPTQLREAQAHPRAAQRPVLVPSAYGTIPSA